MRYGYCCLYNNSICCRFSRIIDIRCVESISFSNIVLRYWGADWYSC